MFSKILTFLKWCVGVFLCAGFVVFTVNNREHIVLDLFPFPFVMNMPKFLFAIVFFALGLAATALIKAGQSSRLKRQIKEQANRIGALENEISGYKVDQSIHNSTPLPSPMKDAA